MRSIVNNLRVATIPGADSAREAIDILVKATGETRQSIIVKSILYAAKNRPGYKECYKERIMSK